MICTDTDCPLFNYESGPFCFNQEELLDISKKNECPMTIVRICASTLPDGMIMDREAYAEYKSKHPDCYREDTDE